MDEAVKLVGRLTLEEKASLLSGRDIWTTRSFPGIPSIMMTDGPHGVRKAGGTSFLGVPATCFPTASALASTWNPDLLYKVGEAIGVEAQSEDVQVVLGPGVNMKRSPLGGRNFEYFSEDPILAARMAIAHVNGVQSQGVGTSLKHFAANNQEYERMQNSSDVDERTLHEIYLRAFELTVKEAQPWSLMASYNLINGVPATESKWLLQDLLRDTWGHQGIVVSDWAAVAAGRVKGLVAGTHLEMPGGEPTNTDLIIQAVKNGEIHEKLVTERSEQLVANILKVARSKRDDVRYVVEEHHKLAREVAGEAIVLLKNDSNVLPLYHKSVAVIGLFAKKPRFQGGGSSQITPTEVDNLYDELGKIYGSTVKLSYAAGYRENGTTTTKMIEEALEVSKASDVVVLAVGLPAAYETEGVDRPTLDLPEGHTRLIEALTKANKHVVVVLTNGSAVSMPWLSNVEAVVEGWLSGQAGAGAMADILTGRVNPSGRLSESFPTRIEDTPAYPDFPNRSGHARYGEGIFIGYRWYDTRQIQPLFEFGYGLSYSQFTYSAGKISQSTLYDDDKLTVSVRVRNTSEVTGKEVVQLYISIKDEQEAHPLRELKQFNKVELAPGEEKTVSFEINANDLAYYSEIRHDWFVVPGSVTVSVGSSSRQIHFSRDINVLARTPEKVILKPSSPLKDFARHPRGKHIMNILGPAMAKAMAGDAIKGKSKEEAEKLVISLMGDLPLDRLPASSGGLVGRKFVDSIMTYCRHEGGLHPLESAPFYKELVSLGFKAIKLQQSTKTKAKE